MKKTGFADLPLHHGRVPVWLAERMKKLGGAIITAIVMEYGKAEVLRKLSDPFWFQSLGCVMGMDWHSSGITTSVVGTLKRAINPISRDLGIYVCGGRGKYSKQTPFELIKIADKTGIDGDLMVRSSRLTAKVDNSAIQDGFQIYLHSFFVTDEGEWAVVQQGMNENTGYARRYHWHSSIKENYLNDPHTAVCGKNRGKILNLADTTAQVTRSAILDITREKPVKILKEISTLKMPSHHEVRNKDVDLKRLGSVLTLAYEKDFMDFESLLLLNGLGPRTLQSLALVSEVIHGTPTRFKDPARFSFAHGGKDGHPFPVPIRVYDETIDVLLKSIEKAKLGLTDKQMAIKNLHKMSRKIEEDFVPGKSLDPIIRKEWMDTAQNGGRTVLKDYSKDIKKLKQNQLSLFN